MSADDGRAPSAVRKSIEPLAAWYRVNKPGVTRMVITADDYDRLARAQKATLARNAISKRGDQYFWHEFELVRK